MICSSFLPKELLALPLSSDFQPCASRGIQLHLPASAANQFPDFYDHSTGEMYLFPLLQAQGMKIAGSAHGWLITTAGKGGTLHLLNPLAGTEIALPLTTAFQNVSMGNFMLTSEDTRGLFMVKASNGDYIVAATGMTIGSCPFADQLTKSGLAFNYWDQNERSLSLYGMGQLHRGVCWW